MINAVTGVQAIVINSTENTKTDASQSNLMPKSELKSKPPVEKSAEEQIAKPSSNVNYLDLADNIKSLLGENNVSLEFKVDDSTKKMVLQIIDSNTKEVIQQVPPEIALKIARFVADQLGNGQVTNAKV
ncbi:MAG: flagellar protein FlaG [Candidatus Kapaibacteriota bacterium]